MQPIYYQEDKGTSTLRMFVSYVCNRTTVQVEPGSGLLVIYHKLGTWLAVFGITITLDSGSAHRYVVSDLLNPAHMRQREDSLPSFFAMDNDTKDAL